MVVSSDIFYKRTSTHAWQILLTNQSVIKAEFCVPVWSLDRSSSTACIFYGRNPFPSDNGAGGHK